LAGSEEFWLRDVNFILDVAGDISFGIYSKGVM